MSKTSSTLNSGSSPRRVRSIWHFTPPLPISLAPFANRSFSPRANFAFLINIWRPFGLRFLLFGASFIIWLWFTPSLDRVSSFELGWMLEVGLRNLVIVVAVTGGLHLYLFTYRKQGDEGHYDTRELAKKSETFHFNDQVLDNMFWTLCSSVPIGTLYECGLLWAYANDYITLITFSSHPIWFIALFLLIPIVSGIHFYWFHRLLHVEPIYRRIHSWHHKNVNTGPWSGHAMHPLEHVGLYSDLLVYWLVAAHPVHVIFNAMLHTVGGPTSHCGYDQVRLGRFNLALGDFFHQLHHRFFDCNYGTPETPWDRIFGSFHDGTEEANRAIKQRRSEMRKK